MHSIIGLLCVIFVGCGGGTYGSGGDDPKIRILVVGQDNTPLKEVLIRSAGISGSAITDDHGLAFIPLNPEFTWSVIRLKYGGEQPQDRYLKTDAVLAAIEPLRLEYQFNSGVSTALRPEAAGPCEEILNSWRGAIAGGNSGLSDQQDASVTSIIGRNDSCENKVAAIADVAFAP